jgi:DNA-binding CsgD family transcriptional regulator
MKFTKTEKRAVGLLMQAMSNKEIARSRNTTEQVIKNLFSKVYDKTGMDNRVELVVAALAHPEWLT